MKKLKILIVINAVISAIWATMVEAVTNRVWYTVSLSLSFLALVFFSDLVITKNVCCVLIFLVSAYWLFAVFRYEDKYEENRVAGLCLRLGFIALGSLSFVLIFVKFERDLLLDAFIILVTYCMGLGAILHELQYKKISN